ncbi:MULTISPECIES: electron transfer flavoprotein subunit alpha/FixB family protein [unclassified Actinobaculum]|uniref:electron transfer flavoprotein subunit alpha/FixB family protein n=1 Tax=unclassified Actinobaculum TaxID=2609299 RepID=UPI000D52A14B|nr:MULTISPECIES: electron transfer flavoprotein subunit alpha/FixB family protein [unclassified Actinobaculum]AWE42076.1 electron transfer flavoprotein subunit alpha/FixB family protein [Actinobaculum sp. 313]RTE50630.1 electron transfer flavoprotein subunit alpha/FixB family protein [Actinobaculum sp. 352]
MANAWIIAVDPQVSALVELGRALGGEVTGVTVGNVPLSGVDRLFSVSVTDDLPAEAAAPAVVAAVAAAPGDVIFAANKSAERVLAGAVAAALGAPVITGVKSLADGAAEVNRYGGITAESVSFSSPIVVIADGGAEGEDAAPAAEVAASEEMFNATVTATEAADVTQANLGAAKVIVAVGRGFKAQEDLKLAEDLAAAVGGEVACSRPLSEGNGWMARDRYIGISGQQVSPDLYIAVGISGQIQHTAGMADSKTVVAINNDANAPIFALSDYGIVGDLYTLLPALTAAAK